MLAAATLRCTAATTAREGQRLGTEIVTLDEKSTLRATGNCVLSHKSHGKTNSGANKSHGDLRYHGEFSVVVCGANKA